MECNWDPDRGDRGDINYNSVGEGIVFLINKNARSSRHILERKKNFDL